MSALSPSPSATYWLAAGSRVLLLLLLLLLHCSDCCSDCCCRIRMIPVMVMGYRTLVATVDHHCSPAGLSLVARRISVTDSVDRKIRVNHRQSSVRVSVVRWDGWIVVVVVD
uniref:Putative secreted peptide n=1 Tax=Anopheles braziliensis TaxID=58242 RepID=A0A2M3ZPZ8_9DIPT